MATQTQTTQTTTDEAVSESPRRFAWVFEHGWLIAGSLLVLAIVPAEVDKAESATMRANRERISAMSRSERQRVEFNFEEYRKLTPQQRRDIKSLHGDVEADPELAATLTAWHQWLAGLTFEDRESILQATDPDARLALVRQVINETTIEDSPGTQPVRSGSPFPNRNFRLPTAAAEFSALMAVIAGHLDMPDFPEDMTLQGRLKHHAAVLAELLLRVRRPNDGPSRPFERARGMFPAELREKLIEALQGEGRREEIEKQNEIEQQRSLAQIVITGFYRELQIVMQQLRPNDDMLLALYLDLPEDQRKLLEDLPEEQFARRLDELWLEREFPTLAKHVREIRRAMPSRMNPRQGFLQNGKRPFIPGARRNGTVSGADSNRE
jgi:hypothetical protein